MSEHFLGVLGGNLMACPAIRRLQEHGHRVLVVDGNPNSPAKEVADHFVHQDFSDLATVRQQLKYVTLSGVMPLNDFAIATASALARERGLPGWSGFAETCLRSKVAMKNAWAAAGLPTARYRVATIGDLLQGAQPMWDIWPCIVKPSFSGGGSRGVFVASGWAAVRYGLSSVQAKYLDGDVLLEEFIAGTEHTLEVLVFHGEPKLLSISDKENYPGSATVVKNLYFPGPIGNAHRHLLEPLVYDACRAMKLTDGTAHFEVMLCKGKPYLLEVGGRPGGGINFHPICELSTGYDYPGLLGSVLTEKIPDFTQKPSAHLAWHYFPAGKGILRSVTGFEEMKMEPQVIDAMLYEEIGKPRMDLRDDLARPGYVLVRADSHDLARVRAMELVARLTFETIDGDETWK
jgi:biotin carboxylase